MLLEFRALEAALQSGVALTLVDLGEFPSEVSHHVERYREDVLPRGDIDRVGCDDLSYRAAVKPQRPHRQRGSPKYFRGDGLWHELEMLQCNWVGVRRSHCSRSLA
jgi:hypothetical protein